MGAYLNPPTKELLNEIGRPLAFAPAFDAMEKQLEPHECLIGLYDRIIFKNAVWLLDPAEWTEFESQVKKGLILRIGYFAVPRRHIPEPFRTESSSEQGLADLETAEAQG